jgi:hypothetical protein
MLSDPRLPFGKHKGKLVSEAPLSYLAWLLSETDLTFRSTLRAAIARRLHEWSGEFAGESSRGGGPNPNAAAVLRRWYRRMANRHHPDKGGSVHSMSLINDAYELLLSEFGVSP